MLLACREPGLCTRPRSARVAHREPPGRPPRRLLGWIRDRRGGQQPPGAGVCRRLQHLGCRPLLHWPPETRSARASWTASSSSFTRCRNAAASRYRYRTTGSAGLSAIDCCGSNEDDGSWKTTPNSERIRRSVRASRHGCRAARPTSVPKRSRPVRSAYRVSVTGRRPPRRAGTAVSAATTSTVASTKMSSCQSEGSVARSLSPSVIAMMAANSR